MNIKKCFKKTAAVGTTAVMSAGAIAVTAAIEIPLGITAVVLNNLASNLTICKDIPKLYAKVEKAFSVDEKNDITEE